MTESDRAPAAAVAEWPDGKELEPLGPGEPGLDPHRPRAGEGNADERLVAPADEHQVRLAGDAEVLESLVQCLQRSEVGGHGPDGEVVRHAHTVLILPTVLGFAFALC